MFRILILLALLAGCEDKVSEPTVEIVDRPAACPPSNPETEESEFSFAGITGVTNVSRTSARIQWDTNNNFSSYHIVSLTNSDRKILNMANEGDSEVLVQGLVPNTSYSVMVRGMDKRGFIETNTKTIEFTTLPWPNYSNLRSLRFNGLQAVTLGESSKFDLSNPFTVSAWVKIQSAAVEEQRIFSFHRGKKASSAMSLGINPEGFTLNYQDKQNKLKAFKMEWSYADSSWHQISLSYDGSFIRVYVDGEVQFTVSDQLKGKTGRHQAHLAAYTGTQKGFVGLMDEFSFFQAGLSPLEAQELFNQGVAFDLRDHSRASDLKHWYRMGDENSDSEANIEDVVGDLNGTPFNITSGDFTNDSP